MKKIIYIFTFIFLFVFSCTGYRSTARSLENQAFIKVIGSTTLYTDGVTMQIDELKPIKVSVQSKKSSKIKSKVFSINTGTHIIKIFDNKKIIYSKQIFIGNQETKEIILP